MKRFSPQWRGFDVPLKVTVLGGIIAGFLGIVSTILYQFQPVDYSAPPIALIILAGSILSLAGAICLLRVPLNRAQQGILALPIVVVSFLLLFASLATINLLVFGTGQGHFYSPENQNQPPTQ